MKLHFWRFKLFPSSKIDFCPFLKLQKMEFGQNNYSWNWFIWFHEFFGWDFWTGKTAKNAISRKKNFLFIWFHEFFFCLDFFKFPGPLWNSLNIKNFREIDFTKKRNIKNLILFFEQEKTNQKKKELFVSFITELGQITESPLKWDHF